MGWKDYFYFTRTERNGILVLLIVLIIILTLPQLSRYKVESRIWDFSEFKGKAEEYQTTLEEYFKAKEKLEEARNQESITNTNPSNLSDLNLRPYHFNPNTLTQEGFLAMGLPERIANNIINYRNAGGEFRFKEDLSRIYTISEDLYSQMAPFIDLPSRENLSLNQAKNIKSETNEIIADAVSPSPLPRSLVIELNMADTASLQKLRGIGPVFSQRIVSYRELLGGYYSPAQLLDVYGMDSIRLSGILENIIVDTLALKKININTADFATLLRHPYLNRNQVNSIIQMRDRHGPFSKTSDITRSALISPDDYKKLSPYLITQEE